MPPVSENHADKRLILESERTALLQRIDELTFGGEVDPTFDDDFSDRGLVASEQGENYALADTLRGQLNLVEHALARLDEGTYGTCEICGEMIPTARLEAIPATSRCIDHTAVAPPRRADG